MAEPTPTNATITKITMVCAQHAIDSTAELSSNFGAHQPLSVARVPKYEVSGQSEYSPWLQFNLIILGDF